MGGSAEQYRHCEDDVTFLIINYIRGKGKYFKGLKINK